MKGMYPLALVLLSSSSGIAIACPVAGEPIQWIVDYCMLKMETDDEIVVSGCIEEEAQKAFSSACASNMHFKRSMCEHLVRNGTREGSVEQCVEDPRFKGRTVEGNGVGT